MILSMMVSSFLLDIQPDSTGYQHPDTIRELPGSKLFGYSVVGYGCFGGIFEFLMTVFGILVTKNVINI